MKKLLFITAVLLLTFTVAACGNNSPEINEPEQEEENNENGETDPAGEKGRPVRHQWEQQHTDLRHGSTGVMSQCHLHGAAAFNTEHAGANVVPYRGVAR